MINSNINTNAFSIIYSSFTLSKSAYGGAIYISDSSLIVDQCNFYINQATNTFLSGEGGSVYIIQSESEYEVNITNCLFRECSADNSGGGIQWYGKQPSLVNNTYLLNSAVYGENFASFPYKLALYESRQMKSFMVAPGQKYESDIVVYVEDHHDQVVTNNNSTLISLSAADISYSISGSTTTFTLRGTANLSNFIVYGLPGSFAQFFIRTSSNLQTGPVDSLDLTFEVRDCIVGEEKQLENLCFLCEVNSFNLKAGTLCLSCPNGAVCYGGSNIVADKGYWRTDKFSTTFFKCPNQDACLIEKLDSDEEHCATGYKGNCCHSCEYGYSRTGTNECSPCLDDDKNTGLLVGLLVLAVLIICGITASNINGAYKEQSIISIYFKILMNYIHLVALTISFNLSWPWFVRKMFEIQGKASGGSDQLISIDCFLNNNIHPYFAKLIILSLIPIVSSLLSILFWGLWSKLKKSQNIKQKIIGSMIVQLFFFQPTLVKYNFTMFNCTEIGTGHYFMTEDLDIQCWESLHLKYTLFVVLPSIFIWCIGIPACLLVFLYKNRKDLNDISEKLKYGFLYKGFKSEVYYWEFIIFLRKILIISCSVFLQNVSVAIQALVVFVIISTGFILQERMQPYCYQQLNKMEIRSIVVSGATIYSGMFFLTGDLTVEGKIVLFSVMVLTNIVFMVYWTYYAFGYYFGKAYLKMRCCKRLFHGKLDKWAAKVVPDGITQITIMESEVVANDSSDKSSIEVNRMNI